MAKPKKTTAENKMKLSSNETLAALRDFVESDEIPTVKNEEIDLNKIDLDKIDEKADNTEKEAIESFSVAKTIVESEQDVDAIEAMLEADDEDEEEDEEFSPEPEELKDTHNQKPEGKRKLASIVDTTSDGESPVKYRRSPEDEFVSDQITETEPNFDTEYRKSPDVNDRLGQELGIPALAELERELAHKRFSKDNRVKHPSEDKKTVQKPEIKPAQESLPSQPVESESIDEPPHSFEPDYTAGQAEVDKPTLEEAVPLSEAELEELRELEEREKRPNHKKELKKAGKKSPKNSDEPIDKMPIISDKPSDSDETIGAQVAPLPGEEDRIPYADPQGGKFFATLTLKLLAISSLTALMLSGVNALTADRIAQNAADEKAAAIAAIFPTGNHNTLIETAYDNIDELYLVSSPDGVIGYSASVSPLGFGGKFSIMVGVSSDGSVAGIEIVSHSETPGLGSRVGEAPFLSQFIGKGGAIKAGADIDVITGSTVSSEAVLEGVNSALAIFDELAAEQGFGNTLPVEDGGNE